MNYDCEFSTEFNGHNHSVIDNAQINWASYKMSEM
jgi:hypothetical protein